VRTTSDIPTVEPASDSRRRRRPVSRGRIHRWCPPLLAWLGGLAVVGTGQFGEADETEAGPVVAGGSVYVTGFDGNLSVFDAAGCGASACKPRWQGHTGNDITSSAAVAGGVTYVGDSGGRLYAFAVSGCGKPVCQPKAFTQLGPDQSYQGASIAVAGGRLTSHARGRPVVA
jgi:hypothetical protein